jgi:hypothetical protein
MKKPQNPNLVPIVIAIIAVLVVGVSIYSYKHNKTGSIVNTQIQPENQDTEEVKNMKEQATAMDHALITRDFETFESFAYPKVVEVFGGKQGFIQTVSSSFTPDVVLEKVTNGEPSKIITAGNELQAVLPQTLEIKIKDGTLVSEGLLIAISSNNGKSWYFIDTGGNSLDKIRTQLPNISADLVLPPLDKPTFTKN